MEIGKIISQRRSELKLTLEDIGNAVGVGKSTVKKWEDGTITSIGCDKIPALAAVLQISPYAIMGIGNNDNYISNIIPVPVTNAVPLLGTIACGSPILAQENLEGEVTVPENIKADFALRCKGDSMVDARINDGDIVYIRQQPIVNNGEIAAVLIGDEATLKRVYISKSTITLMACNSKYEPFVFSGKEIEQVHILGKAVGFTSTTI